MLVPLIWQNRKLLFTVLFNASAAALLETASDPNRRLGAEIGFFGTLHTWGQTLQPHPHIHYVVPGGGLSPDHTRWISTPSNFFLPVKVLSPAFRDKFVERLEAAFEAQQLVFHGECFPLADKKAFATFLDELSTQDWVVYAKPPFGGPEHVLQYLARYTHRVAISNHRLLSVNESEVRFRWRDYKNHNKKRTMTLQPEAFLRRFLQHVLPKGFPRIRYFGWLANRKRARLLPLCRALLNPLPVTRRLSRNLKPLFRNVRSVRGPCASLKRSRLQKSELLKLARCSFLTPHSDSPSRTFTACTPRMLSHTCVSRSSTIIFPTSENRMQRKILPIVSASP